MRSPTLLLALLALPGIALASPLHRRAALGEACTDTECDPGTLCVEGLCQLGDTSTSPPSTPTLCTSSADCGDGFTCSAGTCEASTGTSPKAVGDVCALDAECESSWCTNSQCTDPSTTVQQGAHCLTSENCQVPDGANATDVSCSCPQDANCTAPATDALLCTIATPSTPTLGAVGDSCSEDRGCESLWCSTARICADATTSSGSVAVGDHCLTDVACLQPTDGSNSTCTCPTGSDCSAPATDPLICSTSTPSPTSNTTLLDNGSPCDNDASCTDKFCAASRICTSPTDASLQGAIQDAEHCPAGFNATCIVPQSVQADPPVSAACLCPSSADCSSSTDLFACTTVVGSTPPNATTGGLDCACADADPNNCLDLGPLGDGQFPYCGPEIQKVPDGSTVGQDFAPDDLVFVKPPDPELSDEDLETFKTLELSTLATLLENPLQGEEPISLPYCAAAPSPGRLREKRSLIGDLFKGRKRPTPPVFAQCPPNPPRLNIQVQFTVVTTTRANNELVAESTTATAIEELNRAFSGLGISFSQLGTIWRRSARSENIISKALYDDYQRFARFPNLDLDAQDLEARVIMGADGRRGISHEVLNVFIVEEIVDADVAALGAVINGHCYYPQSKDSFDGCVVTMDSLTGVTLKDAGNIEGGRTLVHEAGHWFGLHHVFDEQGESECQGRNYISTIPQYLYSEKFESTQRPCTTVAPLQSLSERVLQLNYMSYSSIKGGTCRPGFDDFCQRGAHLPWTSEQAASAFANHYIFRLGEHENVRRCFGLQGEATRAKLMARGLAPEHPNPPTIFQRLLKHRARVAKRAMLEQRPNLVEELTAICQTPFSENDPVIAAVLPDASAQLRDEPAAVPFSVSGGSVSTLPGGGIQIDLNIATTDSSGATVTTALPIITQATSAVKQGTFTPRASATGRTNATSAGGVLVVRVAGVMGALFVSVLMLL